MLCMRGGWGWTGWVLRLQLIAGKKGCICLYNNVHIFTSQKGNYLRGLYILHSFLFSYLLTYDLSKLPTFFILSTKNLPSLDHLLYLFWLVNLDFYFDKQAKAMPTTTTAPPPPQKAMIKVGIIFITEPIQLLDVAPIDILGMMEPSYLRALGLPETFCAKGIDFEYHYVNETGKGPNQMSAGFKLAVTVSSPSFLLSP